MKKYKLEDFNDFLLSTNIETIILGLKMIKSSLDFHYMKLDELLLLKKKIESFKYKVEFLFFDSEFYTARGRIYNKIHNIIQKKYSKKSQENSLKRVKLLLNG